MKTTHFLIFVVFSACLLGISSSQAGGKVSTQATYGSAFDEVVVESSLNIRQRASPARHPRDVYVAVPVAEYVRVKRQNRRRGGGAGGRGSGVGSSSSSANAASNSHFARPGGQFGASAANAQAQGFQSQGPLGGFGASSANTQTQGFTAGPNGIRGSAGTSGSQSYNLPNGQTLSLTYSNGFSTGPNGRPVSSGGHSIAFT